MLEAANIKGERLIVLTQTEYDDLIEDAGDRALLAEARANDTDAPLMPADLLEASLNGTMHPLAAWRKAAGMTQAELASKAGLRKATVSNIEGGKIDPRLSSLRALADALHVDIDDIVD